MDYYRCPTCGTHYEIQGHHPACPEALIDHQLKDGPPEEEYRPVPECCDGLGWVAPGEPCWDCRERRANA